MAKVTDDALLRQLENPVPTGRKVTDPELLKQLNAGAEPSAIDSAVGAVRGAVSSVVDAVTGRGQYREGVPELGTSGPDVPAFSEQGMKLFGAYALSPDPKAIADIAIKTLPGSTRKQDEYGNDMVEWKGKEYYINRPGVSEADLFKLTADIAAFAPAAMVSAGPRSVIGRAAVAVPTFGGTSVAQDVAAESLGSEQGVDPVRATVTAATGAAGEMIAPIAVKAWRRIFGDPRFVRDGQLTDAGLRAAREAGLNPDDLTPDIVASFGRNLSAAADAYGARAAAPVAGARTSTDEFSIPYTRGQETGNLDLLRREEATRQAAYGDKASNVIRQFDDEQNQAMIAGTQKVQESLIPPGGTVSPDRNTAVETLREGVSRTQQAARGAVDEAYRAVRGATAEGVSPSFTQEGVKGLERSIKQTLRDPEGGFYGISSATEPLTFKTIREVNALSNMKFSGMKLESIEALRRRIGKRIGDATATTERRALTQMKGTLDDWLDDAVDNAIKSGDPEVLNLLKNARELRTDYGRKFGLTGRGDDAGKFVQKLLDETTTPEELSRALFGAAKMYPQAATRIVSRLKQIVPEDSPEFGAVREMAWMKILSQAVDTTLKGEKSFSAQKFVTSVKTALNDNTTLMRELFTKDQIAMMQRFGAAVERTILPKDAGQPSRTAYVLIQQAREFFKSIATGAAFVNGGPVGAGVTRFGLDAADTALSTSGARANIRNRSLPAPRSVTVPAVGAGVAGQNSPNQ